MGNVAPIEREKIARESNPNERQTAGWRWLNWAWDQRLGNTTLKSVLIALAGHANLKGECWPSVSRLCDRSDAKVRAVQNALRELERRDLICTVHRDGTSSLYRLTPAQDAPPQEMHPARDASPPRTKCTAPPQDVHRTPAGDAPKLPRTPNEMPKEPVCAANAANTSFSEFFEKYPRPGNLEATEDAYEAVLADGVSHSDLMAALKRYCEENRENLAGNKRQYLKYSDSWLTDRYFERYRCRNTKKRVNTEVILEQRAKSIREGHSWVGRHVSAACARELVSRGLVTVEQCRAAGVAL